MGNGSIHITKLAICKEIFIQHSFYRKVLRNITQEYLIIKKSVHLRTKIRTDKAF